MRARASVAGLRTPSRREWAAPLAGASAEFRGALLRHRQWAPLLLAPLCLVAGVAVAVAPWEYLVAAVVAIVATVVVVADPFHGLCLYVLAEYARPGELFPALALLRPQRALAVLLLFSIALHSLAASRGRTVAPSHGRTLALPSMAVVLLLAAAWLSVPGAYWRGGAATTALDFTKTALVFFIARALLDSKARLNRYLWVLWSGSLFVAAMLLARRLTGGPGFLTDGVVRAVGPGQFLANPNDAATALLVGLPLPLGLWAGASRLGRLLLIAGTATSLGALVATGSRGAVLGLLAAALVGWWMTVRGREATSHPRVLAVTLLFVVVGALLWNVAPPRFRERMVSIRQYQSDASARGRQEGWRIATAMFGRQPFTGVGAGNFVPARAAWYGTGDSFVDWMDVHSLYFQTLAELGLVGVVGLMLLIVALLRAPYAALRPSIVALLVAGAFTHLLYFPFLYQLAAAASDE